MKKVFIVIIISLVIAFSFSGCVEHRYYHDNRRHSEDYDHRHHRRTHTDIDLNIHN